MYAHGDKVRVVYDTHYETEQGLEVHIPEGAEVEIEAYLEAGAKNLETKRPIDQVTFYYDGHLIRIGADEVARSAP